MTSLHFRCKQFSVLACILPATAILAVSADAQGTRADYERANTLGIWTAGKVYRSRLEPKWDTEGNRLWYRNAQPGGRVEWISVDAAAAVRKAVPESEVPAEHRQTAPATPTPPQRSTDSVRQVVRRSSDSPDGKFSAFVRDNNVWLRSRAESKEFPLSTDGTATDSYSRITWAPNSKRLIAVRTKAGGDRRVTLVESSPRDQLQPKTSTYFYLKPGDEIPQPKPHLFDVEARREIPVSDALFPTP